MTSVHCLKRALAAIATIAVLFCAAAPARADELGHVLVDVVDAASGTPLAALVALTGPLTTSELGDAKGRVSFYAVPDGVYHARVARGGYVTATSEAFEMAGDRTVTVHVRLVKRSVVKVIGSVSVRSESLTSSTSIDESSPLRRLSQTLPDALGKLSGVELANDDSPGGAQTISLEGHSASQTLATLDGLPLNVPGVAADLRQVATDLFTGASVSFGPSAGAGGGSVNYRTLEPTLRWSTRVAASLSRYDSSFISVSEQGTAGKLGVALQHVSRRRVGGLDGSRYLDASGFDYTHDDVGTVAGDLAKLRYRAGAHDLVATLLTSSNGSSLTCTEAVNAIPCGYGPGNDYAGSYTLSALGDTFALGSASAQLTLFHSASRQSLDFSRRFVDGIASPYGQATRSQTTGATASLQLAPGMRHAVSATAMFLSSAQHADVTDQGTHVAGDQPSSYRSLVVSDRYRVSPKWSFELLAGSSGTLHAPATGLAGVHAVVRANPDETLTFNADATSAVNPSTVLGSLSNPAGLAYNCASETATGYIPADTGGGSASVTSLRAGWQRRIRGARISVTAYDETLRGSVLNVLVNGTAYPALASNYVDAARAIYESPAYCSAARPFDLQNLYFATPLRADSLRYSGARAFVSMPFGKRLVLQSSVDATSVRFASSDPRVSNGLSLSLPGRQLSGVPPLRGNVLLYAAGANPGSLDLMANARYIGWNNAADLPAHWLVDAAAARTFRYGNATLLVTNLFNAHTGLFASPAGALERVTVDGRSVPGIARPNAPRSVTLTYRFAAGASQARQATQLTEAARREESTGPPGYLISRFPDHAPPDPFERNEGSACTEKFRKITDGVLAQLTPLVAKLAAAGAAANTSPAAMPELAGWSFRYSSTPKTYTIAMLTRRIDEGSALASCIRLHVGNAQEGTERGVFVPTVIDLTQQKIFFSPTVGFYIIPIQPPPGFTQKFRTYALPATPPSQPFRVASDEVCIADLKTTATRLLAQLQTYFSAPAPNSGSTEDWTIVRHGVDSAPWYSLSSNDMSAVVSMYSCGIVAAAPLSVLQTRSLEGAPVPSFNFAPSAGLYTVVAEPKKQ